MSTVTWLHISDLHFRASQTYDANVVLRALLLDVAERMAEDRLCPDFIVVTGDIAFSGQAAEYALAGVFFDELLKTTGLTKERLFLVPGNHDVDRGLITAGAKAIGHSLQDRGSANAVLGDPADRRLLLARFEHYATFVNSYLGEHLPFDDENYAYVRTLELGGRRIAILGLNSAWLCTSDEDKAKGLLVGERQARTALEQAAGADLKIALLHHPFDQLREFDRNDVEAMLCAECDFVLHGHMHRSSLSSLKDPDAEAMVLSAGSCYDTREYPNLYSYVRLDLATGTGTVYLRRYSDERGGFWAKDVLTYRNVSDGTYGFLFGLTPATPAHQQRRVDAAVPSNAKVGERIDLVVQVRLPDSPSLGVSIDDWPIGRKPPSVEQTSEPVAMEFPRERLTGRLAPARLKIHVVAPDFTIGGPGRGSQILEIPPDRDSKRMLFLLTPTKPGTCRINIEVHTLDDTLLGTIPLQTTIGGAAVAEAPQMIMAHLLLVVMVAESVPTGQTVQAIPEPVQPPSYDLAAIRDLLRAAFTPETLRRLCYDHPTFRSILTRMGPNDGLNDMVDAVMTYCEKHVHFDELLAEVQRASPRQYARFASRLDFPAVPIMDSTHGQAVAAEPRKAARPLLQTTRTWYGPLAAVIAVVILLLGTAGVHSALTGSPFLSLFGRATATQLAAVSATTEPPQTTNTPSVTSGPSPESTRPLSTPMTTPVPSPVAVQVARLALYEGSARSFAWSPDSKTLLLQGSIVYDVRAATGTRIAPGSAAAAVFAPDGRMVAVATYEGVSLWDVAGWSVLRTLAGSRDTDSLAFTADGTRLATGTGSTVKLWNAAMGEELQTLPGASGRSVAFSPDGKILAATGGVAGQDIRLWDLESYDELPPLTGHSNWINSIAFSPDSRLLASGSVDQTVGLWDLATGRRLLSLTGHTDQVDSVGFSPDGRLLASGSWDLSVRLWDVTDGRELAALTGHTSWINCVAFSPDGTMLASGSGDRLMLWRIE
jgi:predicted phosphodiesterase